MADDNQTLNDMRAFKEAARILRDLEKTKKAPSMDLVDRWIHLGNSMRR